MKNSKLRRFAFRFLLTAAAFGAAPEREISAQTPTDSSTVESPRLVETLPQYPGGQAELLKYLMKNLKAPKRKHCPNWGEKLIATFVVRKDGSVGDVEIVKKVCPKFDAQVLKVLKKMPAWQPATQNGRPVAVRFTLPISLNPGR